MATPAAVLSILLTADSTSAGRALRSYQAQLETANTHIGKVEGATRKMSSSLGTVKKPADDATKSLKGLAKAALEAGGAFVAFDAAKDAIKTTLDLGEATEKLTAITGLDTKTASTWIEAMKVRGVQSKQVSVSFITLSKNIRNAQEGSKTAKKAFDELGISQKELKNDTVQQAIGQVADGLKNLKDPADRAALAQQLFGRGAQALIPVLAQGKKGVDDMLASTQKLGAYLPDNTKQFSDAVDTQRKFGLALDGLKITFTTAVLPLLISAADAVTKFVGQIRSGQGAGGQFATDAKRAFGIVKTAVGDVITAFGGVKTTIEALAGGWAVARILTVGKTLGGTASTIISTLRGGAGAAGAGQGSGALGVVGRFTGVLSKASALSFLAPVGIALGVVIDHWIHTSAEAEGKKFANTFLAPLPDAIKQQFEKPIADAVNRVASIQTRQRTVKTVTSLGTRASGLSPDAAARMIAGSAATDQAIIKAQFFKLGQQAGQATADGLRSVKDVSGPVLLHDFLGRLQQLPAQAKPEAAKAMISFAAELQAQGKLPIAQMQAIMRGLEQQVPGLSAYLAQQGLASDQAFAKALKFNLATKTLTSTLADYRQKFGDWQIATKITGDNIVQNLGTAMEHLHQTVKDSTGRTKTDALAELQKLHDGAVALFKSMESKVATSAGDMKQSIQTGSQQAADTAATNYQKFVTSIQAAMTAGVLATSKGAQLIAQAADATIKAFGGTPIPIPALVHNLGIQALVPSGKTGPSAALHAQGSVVTQPGYFAGEEAPRHPEVILATNPAYRRRNLGLFAQAGHMLGVPGFAGGGIAAPGVTGTGAVSSLVRADLQKIAQAANQKVGRLTPTGGGGFPVAGGGGFAVNRPRLGRPDGSPTAMGIAGVSGPLWLAMLQRQAIRESGGNPNAINLTDSNARAGNPSIGILQTTGTTFNEYALPGHGNIRNPVDNAIAAIRYIIARYGGGNADRGVQVMWARGGGAYKTGGIHGASTALALAGQAPTPLAESAPDIYSSVAQINRILDPTTGTVAALSDRIDFTGQRYDQINSEYATAHPGLDTSTGLVASQTVNGQTIPAAVDTTFVQMRIAQLTQLVQWQARIKTALKNALALIRQAIARIRAEIYKRQQAINAIRAQIETNVHKIDGLQNTLAHTHDKATRKTLNTTIAALEAQNLQLGGAADSVGTGGTLSKWVAQIKSLGGTLDTLNTDQQGIVGPSGIGGTLGTAGINLQNFSDQLAVFSPGSVATALAAAASTDTGAGTTDTTTALLQQIATTAQQQYAVSQAQYAALASTSPFGGHFAQGGVVPGPIGATQSHRRARRRDGQPTRTTSASNSTTIAPSPPSTVSSKPSVRQPQPRCDSDNYQDHDETTHRRRSQPPPQRDHAPPNRTARPTALVPANRRLIRRRAQTHRGARTARPQMVRRRRQHARLQAV